MAIAYDTNGTGGSAAPATSITYNHTITGTDPGLAVFIYIGAATGDGNKLVDANTTYKGATLATTKTYIVPGGRCLYIRTKTAPGTGSGNVVASFSESLYADATSLSYTGVDQTDMVDASNSGGGTATVNQSIATVADNCWLASGAVNTSYGSVNASTGTTFRDSETFGLSVGDSNGAKSPAGTYYMEWTQAGAPTYVIIFSIKPATAAPATSPRRPKRHIWW